MSANMERFRLSTHAEKALLTGSNHGRRDDVCVHIPSSQIAWRRHADALNSDFPNAFVDPPGSGRAPRD